MWVSGGAGLDCSGNYPATRQGVGRGEQGTGEGLEAPPRVRLAAERPWQGGSSGVHFVCQKDKSIWKPSHTSGSQQ